MNNQNSQRQQNEPPAPPPLRASSSTCIVGCKLPHGVKIEMTNSSGRPVSYTVKGMNDALIVGGYGLTEGIPTEFMKAWLEQNSELAFVKNQLIFIQGDVASAKSYAKERREVRTGLEAINPMEKTTASKHGIVNDTDAQKAYQKQVAENPERNKQRVE